MEKLYTPFAVPCLRSLQSHVLYSVALGAWKLVPVGIAGVPRHGGLSKPNTLRITPSPPPTEMIQEQRR